MRRPVVPVVLVVVAFVAIGCVPKASPPPPTSAAGSGGAGAAGTTATGTGSFKTTCQYSHTASDDPIVHPDMAMMSHSHDFFGNTTTDAASTESSLAAGATTCDRAGDHSGYWIPTASYDGHAVTPLRVLVYYVSKTGSSVHPLPSGLKIVAGNAKATGPQSTTVVAWRCSAIAGVTQAYANMPPSCPAASTLDLRVEFPDCWDGVHLDSADHASHMSYDVHHACDAAHPLNVPAVVAEFSFPNPGGRSISLASGPAYTAHGDFFDAWDQSLMSSLVTNCVNAVKNCGLDQN